MKMLFNKKKMKLGLEFDPGLALIDLRTTSSTTYYEMYGLFTN